MKIYLNAEKIKKASKEPANINNVINVNGQTVKGQGKTTSDGIVDIDLTYKDGKYYLKIVIKMFIYMT